MSAEMRTLLIFGRSEVSLSHWLMSAVADEAFRHFR